MNDKFESLDKLDRISVVEGTKCPIWSMSQNLYRLSFTEAEKIESFRTITYLKVVALMGKMTHLVQHHVTKKSEGS